MEKSTVELIEELKKYDNPKGYKLEYKDVQKRLEPIIKELSIKGEGALELLHDLLNYEETWSSVFALEILKNIKSEKSIFPLINYILKTEKEDYGDYGEDAMFVSLVYRGYSTRVSKYPRSKSIDYILKRTNLSLNHIKI